jgi:hypothetical protein
MNSKQTRSPRQSDPDAWHAFFVPPSEASEADAKSPIYRLFISGASWATLLDNVEKKRLDGACGIKSSWNAMQPVVLVYKNDVCVVDAYHTC